MNMDVIEGFHGYHLTGLPTIITIKHKWRLNKTRGVDITKEAKNDIMETQQLIWSSQSV